MSDGGDVGEEPKVKKDKGRERKGEKEKRGKRTVVIDPQENIVVEGSASGALGGVQAGRPSRSPLPGTQDRFSLKQGLVEVSRWEEKARTKWPVDSPGLDEDEDDGSLLFSPVFVLASGWRTGSTYVQRLMMGEHDETRKPYCLMYGEPLGWMAEEISAHLRAFANRRWIPEVDRFLPEDPDRCTEALQKLQFPANLYPPVTAVRRAHRAFFRELFLRPAQERGFERWGIKFVRMDAEIGSYLRWLYPRGRVIYVTRSPYSAWRSYNRFIALSGWSWPYRPTPSTADQPMTPRQFATHWYNLLRSFQEDAAQHPDSTMLVLSERLRHHEEVQRLEKFSGVKVSPGEEGRRTGQSFDPQGLYEDFRAENKKHKVVSNINSSEQVARFFSARFLPLSPENPIIDNLKVVLKKGQAMYDDPAKRKSYNNEVLRQLQLDYSDIQQVVDPLAKDLGYKPRQ